MQELGSTVQSLLFRAGIDNARLAVKVGLSEAYLSRILAGKANITGPVAAKIVDTLTHLIRRREPDFPQITIPQLRQAIEASRPAAKPVYTDNAESQVGESPNVDNAEDGHGADRHA